MSIFHFILWHTTRKKLGVQCSYIYLSNLTSLHWLTKRHTDTRGKRDTTMIITMIIITWAHQYKSWYSILIPSNGWNETWLGWKSCNDKMVGNGYGNFLDTAKLKQLFQLFFTRVPYDFPTQLSQQSKSNEFEFHDSISILCYVKHVYGPSSPNDVPKCLKSIKSKG